MPDAETSPFAKLLSHMSGTRLDPAKATAVASASAPVRASLRGRIGGQGSATTAPASGQGGGSLAGQKQESPFAQLARRGEQGTASAARAHGGASHPLVSGLTGTVNRADSTSSADIPQGEPTTPKAMGFGLGRAAATAPSAAAKAITYSDEQLDIIHCNDRLVVADAFAGCAKTTTSIGFANARPNQRILYLCLNTANAIEAKGRFGANVDTMTTHALAWKEMKHVVGSRISQRWKPMMLMDQLRIQKPRVAANTKAVLEAFFASTDRDLTEKHANAIRDQRNLAQGEVDAAVSFARMAWKRMCDPNDKLEMPHDAYLKMFALRAPQLPYAQIILDEAQDTNPVTLQIVQAQKSAKLLAIGDRHQSIYAFRGSMNAMEALAIGATRKHLSQTWRFGPEIAKFANTLLAELKDETVPIRAMGEDGKWNPKQVTHLARTNAQLFRMAAQHRGQGVHWIGGADKYRLEMILDAYHLYAGNRSEVTDYTLKKHHHWDDFVRYAEDAMDGEARVLVKAVEEFQHDTPDLISDIRTHAIADARDASLILTTAHKSKGLEWDCVQVGEDFDVLEGAEWSLSNGEALPDQDVNLLYVAATRAKKALELNQESRDWLAQLDTYRRARRGGRAQTPNF